MRTADNPPKRAQLQSGRGTDPLVMYSTACPGSSPPLRVKTRQLERARLWCRSRGRSRQGDWRSHTRGIFHGPPPYCACFVGSVQHLRFNHIPHMCCANTNLRAAAPETCYGFVMWLGLQLIRLRCTEAGVSQQLAYFSIMQRATKADLAHSGTGFASSESLVTVKSRTSAVQRRYQRQKCRPCLPAEGRSVLPTPPYRV
jgi:hypothetical protein